MMIPSPSHHPQRHEPETRRDDGAQAARPKRVLLVEDEYLLAQAMVAMLEDLGYAVVGPAATIKEGLELVRLAAIDGAVLDVNLRGHQAFEIADALRGRGVPFLFTTGYANATMPERFHGQPRLQKPFAPTNLKILLAATLADAGLGAQRY